MTFAASHSPYRVIEGIPTGLPALDALLYNGGVPKRRITEISGPWSAGKTTLALSTVAEAQKRGMKCLWADIEFSWDESYAQILGVDLEALDLIQERYAETALDALELAVDEGEYDLVVLDSIGGLLPNAEATKDASARVIGGQAKLVSTFCRKIVPLLAMRNTALVVINHEFLDIMGHGAVKTSGGAKLEYHKSIWVRLKKLSKRLMQGDQQIGEIIEAEIRKNKLAATQKQSCELHMIYGAGFSREADLAEQALEKGVLIKKGQTYYLGEEKIAVGMPKLRDALKDEALVARIQAAL